MNVETVFTIYQPWQHKKTRRLHKWLVLSDSSISRCPANATKYLIIKVYEKQNIKVQMLSNEYVDKQTQLLIT